MNYITKNVLAIDKFSEEKTKIRNKIIEIKENYYQKYNKMIQTKKIQ